jgi:hypothetical protein
MQDSVPVFAPGKEGSLGAISTNRQYSSPGLKLSLGCPTHPGCVLPRHNYHCHLLLYSPLQAA